MAGVQLLEASKTNKVLTSSFDVFKQLLFSLLAIYLPNHNLWPGCAGAFLPPNVPKKLTAISLLRRRGAVPLELVLCALESCLELFVDRELQAVPSTELFSFRSIRALNCSFSIGVSNELRQPKKRKGKEKTKLHRQRYRLRRCIRFTYRRVTRMVRAMHHKLSSWLATNYNQVLLPSFQTNEMVRKYEKLVAGDGTPATSSDEVKQAPAQGGKRQKRKREIRSSTARAMLAQSHYTFKMLLKYKMDRVGGRMIECEEEYTSKSCSSCGGIKDDLGGSSTYKCSSCHVVLDQDAIAAKNIFHKNIQTLCKR